MLMVLSLSKVGCRPRTESSEEPGLLAPCLAEVIDVNDHLGKI